MLEKPDWIDSTPLISVSTYLYFYVNFIKLSHFNIYLGRPTLFVYFWPFITSGDQDSNPGWLHMPAFPWLNLTTILNLGMLTNLPTLFKHLLPLYYIWRIKSYSMLHKYFRVFLHSLQFLNILSTSLTFHKRSHLLLQWWVR